MIQVIEAPEYFVKPLHVFLAGGITNCPNWQRQLIEMLNNRCPDKLNMVLFNPRRDNFDVTKTSESQDQIFWEHQHLQKADAHVFWFPKETLCPITLFELGKIAPQNKPIFVGCDPDYARKLDVEEQLKLIRKYDCEISTDIGDLATRLISWGTLKEFTFVLDDRVTNQ